MYETIIFDFGRVLINYDFQPAIRHWFPDPALRKRFSDIFCSDEFIDACDLGVKTVPELLQSLIADNPDFEPYLSGKEGLDISYYVQGVVPGMTQLLTELRGQGIRLLGLTNWSATIYKVIERYPEIFALLDGRIISSEEHLIKPDIRIFQLIINRYKLNPSECLFVDDKQKNIDGAIRAGLDGHIFTTAYELRAFLKTKQ